MRGLAGLLLGAFAGAVCAETNSPPLVFTGADGQLAVPVTEVRAAGQVTVHAESRTVIELSPAATDAFRSLTTAHMNRTLDIAICDRVLAAPTVREEIVDGRIMVTLPNLPAAEAAAAVLNGTGTCSGLLRHLDG